MKLVAETGTSLDRIVERVAKVNTVVSEIATNAQSQAAGLKEVNTAVGQMDQTTQQNAAMAEESTAATRVLLPTSRRNWPPSWQPLQQGHSVRCNHRAVKARLPEKGKFNGPLSESYQSLSICLESDISRYPGA